VSELRADLTSQHIEGLPEERVGGFLRHRGLVVPMDIPLISHITGNLYVGGCKDGVVIPEGIDHVVSLYPWERYDDPEHTLLSRLEVRLYDTLDLPDFCELEEIAEHAGRCLKRGPTLIHCQAGINRSSLVAALTLYSTGATASLSQAIALLRERRSPLVLSNIAFERMLLELDDGTRRAA